MKSRPLPLDRLGRRFSIRLHDPEGGYRDLVGHLKSASSILNRHGQEVSFDPGKIFVWREIVERPTRAGKGAPLTLRVFELDQICDLTWPATEKTELSGWLLRASNGVTNRANSVLPLAESLKAGSLTNLTEKLAATRDFYQDRDLPVIFQLALPTWQSLSDELKSLGAIETLRGNTMVADLNSTNLNIPTGFEIVQSAEVNQEWLSIQSTPGINAILTGCAATYLTVLADGQPVGAMRFALANNWSSVTRVFISEKFRGKGLGKALVSAGLAASIEQGATKALLQVEANNLAAIRVYESLGFNFHHEYVYLELK